ncbi:MAG TPA: nuclear transport factor 2 family protein [Kofleriaceae bacterium]|jgi:ketosteroid isomerase-like protein
MRLAALAVVCAACATPRAYAPADDGAIRAVIDAQSVAWNHGDLDGYMAGYAHVPDLVFTSGGKVRRGWDETIAKYRARYTPGTMGHLAFAILAIQPLGADGAIVLGRWRLTDTPNAGAGVFSLGFARTPAGWRIVHDHTSLDAP